MTTATLIAPDRLNGVRRARKLGRSRLAKLTGMTERQLARLENAGPVAGDLTADTLNRLASALQVAPEILTGEAPLNEADMTQTLPVSTCRTGCCG